MSEPVYYSLENLAKLREQLAGMEPGNRSGGNPSKGVSQMRGLRSEIELIETVLKIQGVIAHTPTEKLKMALDDKTRGRRKGCCVEHEGQWYRIRYTSKDDRGNWQWSWMQITAQAATEAGSYVHSGPQQ